MTSPSLSVDFVTRAKRLKVLVFDVDGVLTDGALWFGPAGEALKRFHVRDGLGMVSAVQSSLITAILSGRNSLHVNERAKELRVAHVLQGIGDKAQGLEELCRLTATNVEQCAFMGDDVNDLPALERVGLAACPLDAMPSVRSRCHFVSSLNGGWGAAREFIDNVIAVR